MRGEFPAGRHLKLETRGDYRQAVLERPVVLEDVGPVALDVLVADHVARIRLGELKGFASDVRVLDIGEVAVFYGVFFADGDFVAVRFDRPRFHVGDLGVFIEIDVDATVLAAGFDAEQANGDAMESVDLAVIVDGGLRFVEQDDRIGVLVVVRQLFLRGGAEPVGRGIARNGSRRKRAEGRQEEGRQRKGASCSPPTRYFRGAFGNHHSLSPFRKTAAARGNLCS